MRVLALTKYGRMAASTRQRIMQYRPYLEERGMTIEIEPLLDDALFENSVQIGKPPKAGSLLGTYVRRASSLLLRRDFDVLWISYELFPYLPGFFERLAFLPRRPVVVDYDDAIFHMYDLHRKGFVRWLLADKLRPLLRSADTVICGNEYLRDYAAQFCPNSVIVPTVVDTEVYRPASRSRSSDHPLVIGWIGSPSTWVNVEPLLPAILATVERHGAVFRAIGGGPRAKEAQGVEALDWREEREVQDIQNMDIGIMPLLDDPFQRGKCGYKLIQYMATGLPVLASPVGVNRDIVAPGQNGFLATSASEWTTALEMLLGDAALRRQLGAAGRKIVEKEYSLRAHQGRVFDLLSGAVERARRPSVS